MSWTPASRLPDPAVEVLDPRFAELVLFNAKVERIAEGFRWAEGPVWFGDGRYLLWSDVAGDRMLRWDEQTGAVATFRAPSNNSNGNTRDNQGRLVTCEHASRRVTRTEYDGTITVLADSYDGKRLNSPNDVIVGSDGAVWFSDPTFGILGDYEGHRAEPELPTNLYRLDPATGELRVASGELRHPNGLAFSPDGSVLYVVESTGMPRQCITAFDVAADGTLTNRRLFIDGEGASPDGLRIDEAGNLWCAWSGGEGVDGVRVFAPDGAAIGHIHLPEPCANVAFGGRALSRLFMTATSGVYSLFVRTRGLR
ncbi:MAG: SMP-30/gluconolactonase/LRE family protein [Microbacteriaceae bacterium]|nr:SMP-30/gluconolactonase/LRE family protein [Microbacteriaceae bacterium]